MKLLVFSTEFPPGPGGIGTHAWQLSNLLNEKGWDVLVLSQQDYCKKDTISIFNQKQQYKVITLRHLPGAFFDAIFRTLLLIFWGIYWKPNVIFVSGLRAVWIMSIISIFWNVPWFAVGHGTEFTLQKNWQKKLTKWAFNQANYLIAVSQYTSIQMKKMGIRSKYLSVIKNGADEKVFAPIRKSQIKDFRKKYSLPQNARCLLTVGQVSDRKGQDIVIKSLANIIPEIPDVHYLVVGLPTLQEKYEKIATQLGILDRIHFLGTLNSAELVQAYNACDVFVMTSRLSKKEGFEGFGIAAIEAALCGKPTVASNNSGLAEAVIDGKTGILVPQENSQRTAQAIISLLKNHDLRCEMGENARNIALKMQTWTKVSEEYNQFLRKMIIKK
jgi:phosphatidyl-myo-inositol dimannoside synthase